MRRQFRSIPRYLADPSQAKLNSPVSYDLIANRFLILPMIIERTLSPQYTLCNTSYLAAILRDHLPFQPLRTLLSPDSRPPQYNDVATMSQNGLRTRLQ